MKLKQITLAICWLSVQVIAQTGPAGVSNSTFNGIWLKADKGTSTTVDGGAIETWEDQSGNGNDMSQSTVAQRPLYQEAFINGYPSILFDNINSSGQNDYFSAPDSPDLDNSDGFSMFSVVRPLSNNNSARSIFSKRTNVGVNQAYMLFLYTGNRLTLDVVTNNNRFDSNPTTFPAGTNYILSATYDGSLPTGVRSKLFNGQTNIRTASESSASMPDYNSPIIIGATHVGDSRPFDGHMAEMIYFSRILNTAEKIVVDNYLSSKYNISLASNDYYAGDTPANGDFDREVAGIGQVDASNKHDEFAPSAAGGLGIANNSIFEDGDYLFVGHDLDSNYGNTSDIAVVSGGPISLRWERIWYIDVTNTGGDITATISFDISDGGMGDAVSAGSPFDYKLLYRSTNSGDWTIVATASMVAGDMIMFDYDFSSDADDGYYTIATLNYIGSPLPIELLNFTAERDDEVAQLNWQTASERDNAYFSVERSVDGKNWGELAQIKGRGNSNTLTNYELVDNKPFIGTNYYRLKQVDFNGEYTYSPIRSVVMDSKVLYPLYPNPAENKFHVRLGNATAHLSIYNVQGKLLLDMQNITGDVVDIDISDLPSGMYTVQIKGNKGTSRQKLVIQ
jgi:hypothetical protein